MELDAHRRRGDGEHAAELAAAQDANLGVPGQPIVAHRVGVVVRLAAEEPRAHADRGTAGGAGGSAAAPGARHGDRRNVGGAHRCEHRDDGFSNRATANWGSGVGGQEETVAGERWADAWEGVGCSRAIEPRPIRASAGWCDDWLGPPARLLKKNRQRNAVKKRGGANPRQGKATAGAVHKRTPPHPKGRIRTSHRSSDPLRSITSRRRRSYPRGESGPGPGRPLIPLT